MSNYIKEIIRYLIVFAISIIIGLTGVISQEIIFFALSIVLISIGMIQIAKKVGLKKTIFMMISTLVLAFIPPLIISLFINVNFFIAFEIYELGVTLASYDD